MENVRAVFVHVDALDGLRVHVACNMGPLVDDKRRLSVFLRLLCKHRPVEPRADDEVIIGFVHPGFPFLLPLSTVSQSTIRFVSESGSLGEG